MMKHCLLAYHSTGSDWLRVTPQFFRPMLRWLRDEYDNVAVLVTENGVSDRNATLRDEHRVNYYRDFINEMLKGASFTPYPLPPCDKK